MSREMDEILKPLVKLGKSPDDCWEWQGKIASNGYGAKQSGGRTLLAHRWVFSIFNGWIPKEAVLNHLCSNRRCVNPKHIEVTTQAGNARHGRGAKLKVEQVREIKAALSTIKWGEKKHLAAKFGVSAALLSDIKYGRAWRDI
jgi:hypothetical protein